MSQGFDVRLTSATLALSLLLVGGCSAQRRPVAPVAEAAPTVGGLDLLRSEFTTTQNRTSARGVVLTMPDVLVEVDKVELNTSAQRDLAAIAAYLKGHPNQKALIEGHTDNIGSETYNHELSLRRSTAVETFFLRNGVDPERLEVRGLGADHPVASNSTPTGRQQNRRVEIVLLNAGESTAGVRQGSR